MADKNGILKLDLRNVYGTHLGEPVDINLRNMSLQHEQVVRGVKASRAISIKELHDGPNATYRVEIDPPSYRPVGFFARADGDRSSAVMMSFPVDPAKVTSVEFAEFPTLFDNLRQSLERSDSVPGLVGQTGETLYEGLDDIRRAGLMNIAHKSAATMLTNGNTVFSYVDRFAEVLGDRIFVRVDGELSSALESTASAGQVERVSAALHKLPPAIPDFDSYQDVGSYKTEDRYGNLQVSVFRRDSEFIADIDIDDAAGLGHVFQVLRNHLTGLPTHPFDIHEILMQHQGLYPNYKLHVA